MKKQTKAPPAKDVDDYLASVSEQARVTLEKLRRIIIAAAPEAKEIISWRMPMYYYHGMLVGFAAFKDHLSFFPGSSVMKKHEGELKNYDTAKGTIHFPMNKPLPAALVKKLVKARIKENEARVRARTK
ncbi:MAG: hypothetical protein A3K60_08300 [Euryarchaeota archaeon RBG_19FT_COMBO_56_21]|nr:MAG: hypothetical protein A3K60_08300 [Euryarchaeota archaeon RBG_19FT_COMBO_56_21]